jgi:dTDP-4-amino-4,6-dideoxygalactose transaminase
VKFIPISKPSIIQDDIELVSEVLRSGMLVQGKYVTLFEEEIASYIGVSDAVLVSNGTASMHIMLKALCIGEGDEVIVPAFSYVATANVVELVGAVPVFVDICKRTFNIDVAGIQSKITPKTRAVLAVHEFGLPADVFELKEICDSNNILFLEDAACALGAIASGQMVGSFGHSASFSLHPRKAITSGEGGIITTNDSEFAEKCRTLRNHGLNLNYGNTGFIEAGFNYRITDFQAALVHSQFLRFDKMMLNKTRIANRYLNEINNPKIQLPISSPNSNHSWQSFHILLNQIEQKKAISYLNSKNIGANYGAQCIPAVNYYHNKYKNDFEKDFPNAWNAFKNGLVIPLYEHMEDPEIDAVINELNKM